MVDPSPSGIRKSKNQTDSYSLELDTDPKDKALFAVSQAI